MKKTFFYLIAIIFLNACSQEPPLEHAFDPTFYVQSAFLNERLLENSWFIRQDLINKGSLKLVMGPNTNKNWEVENPPPSMTSN